MIPLLNRGPQEPPLPQPETASPHTEIWTPGKPETQNLDPQLELAINDVIREMNDVNPQQTIHELQRQVRMSENGVMSAILYGRNRGEYSTEEAIVMFNPFANTASANMLVRAEFIRQVAKKMNVRDEKGKLKPVIMVAAPGVHHPLKLTKAEKEQIKNGNLGPAARELLRGISGYEMGKIALLGFSQGGDIALAAAQEANSHDYDVDALSIGDPAATTEREPKEIKKHFMETNLLDLRRSGKATGLKAQEKALLGISGLGLWGIAKFAAHSQTPTNKLLWKGMTHDTFALNMQALIDQGRVGKKVVGYSGKGAIANPDWFEPAIEELYDENGPDSFISIKVDGADHTWGDRLELLVKLYMRALL